MGGTRGGCADKAAINCREGGEGKSSLFVVQLVPVLEGLLPIGCCFSVVFGAILFRDES